MEMWMMVLLLLLLRCCVRWRRTHCVGDARAWFAKFKSTVLVWIANSKVIKRRMRQPIGHEEEQQWKNAEFDGWGGKRSSQKRMIKPIRNCERQPRNSLTFWWGHSVKCNESMQDQAVIRQWNKMCDTEKHMLQPHWVALTHCGYDTDRTTDLCHWHRPQPK